MCGDRYQAQRGAARLKPTRASCAQPLVQWMVLSGLPSLHCMPGSSSELLGGKENCKVGLTRTMDECRIRGDCSTALGEEGEVRELLSVWDLGGGMHKV